MFCGDRIWIGIDDTDSTKGGCTTYVAKVLVKELLENNYDIIGHPRLIRLNPNIPWKTRGNGAISIQVGVGAGNKIKIGEVGNKEIFSYERLANEYDSKDFAKIKKIAKSVVEKHSKMEDEKTNPGFVILQNQPSYQQYKKAVTEVVSIDDVKNLLNSLNAYYEGYKNCRGLIGATSAVSWSPNNDKTYELIAYREKKRWGTKREIDEDSVKKMDKMYQTTFDNYDYSNKHNRLVPNSPCPVLFGIRGDIKEDIMQAYFVIKSEPFESWMLFETNQGTDDHLQKKDIRSIQPYQSVIVEGEVIQNPHTTKGGHVFFAIKDSTGEIDCAAYEPTKQFRNIIRELSIGDILETYGGVREKPLTINIEKINVKHLTNVIEKIENPICPKCGKHMKSRGKNKGYKCKICGTTQEKAVIKKKKRRISKGFYEVPICARRHLSKPLKRMKQP